MKSILVLLFVLLTYSISEAGYYLCGKADVVVNVPTLFYYRAGIDPSVVPVCPAPYTLTELTTNIQAQEALYNTTPNKLHLKVVAGVLTLMTPEEQAIVDAPRIALQAKRAAAKAEIEGNNICANNTLAEISAYWDARQAELQTAVGPVPAGATKQAIIATMTLLIDSNRQLWRYICSRTVVRP